MSPCDHCPLIDRNRPCLAVESNHARYCQLATTDPAYHTYLANWQGRDEQNRRDARARRAAKRRGSLADAVRAARECAPCREASSEVDAR